MSDLLFLSPAWLWLLVPELTVLGYLRWRAFHQDKQAGQGVIAEHLAVHFRQDNQSRKNYWPIYAAGVISTLLIVMLAQPVWRQSAGAGKDGAPLLIVMDESQSMLKNDVSPSRDARAHLLIDGLLSKGLNRPVGLLATAGSSHVLLPPAKDVDIVKLYLSYLDPGVMPADGGDLSGLVNLLRDTPGLITSGSSLLLVTDGMTSGADELKQYLNDQQVPWATLTFTAMGAQTAQNLGGLTLAGDELTPQNQSLFKMVAKLAANGKGSSQNWVDEYRWFAIPVALMLLFFFRRGVTLYWAPAALTMFLMVAPGTSQARMIDWFFTPDQQGMLLMKKAEYTEASQRFEDTAWKAVACYYAEDWECARAEFAKLPSEDGIYNLATTAAQAGLYKLSRDLYAQLLQINPDYPHAKNNHEQVAAMVEDINRMSESQKDDSPPGDSDQAGDVDQGGAQQIADGAEEQSFGTQPAKSLTAEEILQSQDGTEKWLRDISRDPKSFIRAKFLYEYNQGQGNDSAP